MQFINSLLLVLILKANSDGSLGDGAGGLLPPQARGKIARL